MKLSLCFSGFIAALTCASASAQTMIPDASAPSVAPDGRVVFVRHTGSGARLFVGDKMIGRSSSGRGDDLEPCWRADGQAIVFASNRGGNFDLYSVRPDGGGLKQITRTLVDERDPQWSPHPIGWREGDVPIVPNRSLGHIGKSDLQTLQTLAGNANVAAQYERSSDTGTYFNIKPGLRYWKLLCTQAPKGKPAQEQLVFMREDGSLRYVVSSGMPGALHRPRWERTGQTIAFSRVAGRQEVLYSAPAPVLTEVAEYDKPPIASQPIVIDKKTYRVGFDAKAWRTHLTRVALIAPSSALNWTPNGEFVAVASGKTLRLIARRDINAVKPRTEIIALPGGVQGINIAWRQDARTALMALKSGASATLREVRLNDSLLDVTNWLDFASYDDMNPLDRAMLARQSFAASGDGYKQMYSIYETADYDNLPVFISSDSLLHLNHLVFDYVFRSVESEHLLPDAIALTGHYLAASIQQAEAAQTPEDKSAALANAAFFAVAARLAKGEVKTGLESDVPAPTEAEGSLQEEHRIATAAARKKRLARLNALTAPLDAILKTLPAASAMLADQEIALIREHKERTTSPIFGGVLTDPRASPGPVSDTRVDYTDFQPRGHYTRTEILRRYFLMSRWLSGAPFRVSDAGVRQSLLLVAASDAESLGRLAKMTRVTADFVGGADDYELTQYARIARQVFGSSLGFAEMHDAAKVADFTQRINALPGPKIAASAGAAMRVLPQAYTFDAEIMQNMVYDGRAPDVGTSDAPRFFALGLDVMGVLGSNRARSILDNYAFQGSFFDSKLRETQYANYGAQFAAERAKIAAMKEADWKQNLYNRTLYALQPLLAPQSLAQFGFTRTPAWTDKQLNTALATWAELKHDTMPKQPVAIEGGEGGLSESVLIEQPQGFVEPSPEVYRRLSELVGAERAVLLQSGYLSPALSQRLNTLGALLQMVTRLEAKQRLRQPWTPGEIEQLRFFGVFLEHLTLTTLEGQSDSLEDLDMALIADVSAAFSTRLQKQLVLEEGVGHALPIYVAVERGQTRTLCRGAIFTYYEFTYPASDRLTDGKWQEYLALPDRPKTPAWTQSFIATHRED